MTLRLPGYSVSGDRTGSAGESTVNRDIDIAFNFITAHEGMNWPAEDVIVFGRSIGSGPAAAMAAHKGLGGCVLISPYTSIKAMVAHRTGILLLAVSD